MKHMFVSTFCNKNACGGDAVTSFYDFHKKGVFITQNVCTFVLKSGCGGNVVIVFVYACLVLQNM